MGERRADCSGGFVDRMKVISGRTGRRRWPDNVKARIVRESFKPGAVVNDVAFQHGVEPSN